jgi:transglutaminase-like putative cysteine protease
MKYRITHKTVYSYSDTVSLCQNQAYLTPRDSAHQTCLNSQLWITPMPAIMQEHTDFFNNHTYYFTIQTPHNQLTVTAISDVEISHTEETGIPFSPPWESVRNSLETDSTVEGIEARGLILESPFITIQDQAIIEYALVSFTKDRPLLEAVQDLTTRIYTEFTYDPNFTTIATPLSEVLEHRRGVCQDFAHLGIACVRAMGLPARYVSGYLETLPPPGQVKLQGVDASHAWLSVYIPEDGWFDFDPTNNQMATEQYITTAWGRDYEDVTPLKGIIFGGGEHQLSVYVDVERLLTN